MSGPIHLIASSSVPGYGPSDGRCLPCSGVSGSIISISSSASRSDYNSFSQFKTMSLKCSSRSQSSICSSSSGNYRRNPDSPRQNKHGFSQFHNDQTEDNDGSTDDLVESEHFSSKNGSLISSRFQSRSAPGPKEKEVIKLFRKVQAQLRAKAIKQEEKIEDLPGPKKESNNAVSLLKVLRKYSVPQGDRSSSKDFISEQGASNGTLKHVVHKREHLSASSLISNFRPRSPVPQVKYQPNYSNDETVNSDEPEPDREPEPEPDPVLLNRAIFEEISDDEILESDEEDNEDDAEEQNMIERRDFSTMKLTELRALAKSQGIKGFSKLKKRELTELLSGGSI